MLRLLDRELFQHSSSIEITQKLDVWYAVRSSSRAALTTYLRNPNGWRSSKPPGTRRAFPCHTYPDAAIAFPQKANVGTLGLRLGVMLYC